MGKDRSDGRLGLEPLGVAKDLSYVAANCVGKQRVLCASISFAVPSARSGKACGQNWRLEVTACDATRAGHGQRLRCA
jgi:hypothetical protein